jgi:hypothetical protein
VAGLENILEDRRQSRRSTKRYQREMDLTQRKIGPWLPERIFHCVRSPGPIMLSAGSK